MPRTISELDEPSSYLLFAPTASQPAAARTNGGGTTSIRSVRLTGAYSGASLPHLILRNINYLTPKNHPYTHTRLKNRARVLQICNSNARLTAHLPLAL